MDGARTVLEFLESSNDIAVGIRLIIATFFGSLIGWERIVKRHSAGIKTFALVSLVISLAILISLPLNRRQQCFYVPDKIIDTFS